MLKDNHGRIVNYMRLAVTDRCNLRCFYCMPADGLDWLSRRELMTDSEMMHVCQVLVNMGVEKIRITGGEPFLRKGVMNFLSDLSKLPGLNELTITTNGLLTAPLVPDLKKIGIRSVNLSLDTLDANRFFAITRRDELSKVLDTLQALLHHGINVKLNAVVMDGKNTQDIIPLVALTRELPISVRFIEEMPFNGATGEYGSIKWDHIAILQTIKDTFPDIEKLPDPPFSTSYNYQIPGHKGSVGIIAAYTRSFCGTCNRLRITADGLLKMCLYDHGVLNIKDVIRNGADDLLLEKTLLNAIDHRAKDGWEAEKLLPHHAARESMATIGG